MASPQECLDAIGGHTGTPNPPPDMAGRSTIYIAGTVKSACQPEEELVVTPFMPALATVGDFSNPVSITWTTDECIDGRTFPGGFYFVLEGEAQIVESTYNGRIDIFVESTETFHPPNLVDNSFPMSQTSPEEFASYETCALGKSAAKAAFAEEAYSWASTIAKTGLPVTGFVGIWRDPSGFFLEASGEGLGSFSYNPGSGLAGALLGLDTTEWSFTAQWTALDPLCDTSTACATVVVLEEGQTVNLLRLVSL